jgi:3-oxo-5-alpha-steroid 4-dehydrogenase 1
MLDNATHWLATQSEFALALVTMLTLVFISAPYGRHKRAGWGPTMSSRWAWVLMESPAALAFGLLYLLGSHRFELVPLLFCSLWLLHYGYRAFIYPFKLEISGKRVPLLIPLLAILFNLLNAYVNALWIGHLGSYETSWLMDPRFLAGLGLFFWGRHINLSSDAILRGLRKPGETGYVIPKGGFYQWVSAPNYLGEILQWFGWALLTWSWAGLAFAVYTTANLAPRAASNHAWYLGKFPDYPTERKRLIPKVW